ncbi:Putative, 10TM heavy-metal exporter [Cetobacterium ceti]|uniref:Putative, 10TM heavy-metal exporter n=1 Tax=Cetobacterium ceti TaxID=180163 RepID=A0A1T4QTL5_9FUSO|nr:putative manganese transporter [Cetobacterium ceti]SKA07045.1 Putative, 10TM heavy-metal exporter [Cetobacterium ceti]
MIRDILYQSAGNSFILVGSFVAVTLLIFNILDEKTNGKMLKIIENNKKLQIYIGTFLGLTPGCGGAIMVVPLYLNKKVSFGTLVATFIATMGDAAFVLMVGKPKIFIYLLIISGTVAIVTGLIIDKFKIGQNLLINLSPAKDDTIKIEYKPIENFLKNYAYIIFIILSLIGFYLGVNELFQNNIDHLYFLGVVGTIYSIIYTILNKIIDTSFEEKIKNKWIKLGIHISKETAFVISWVFVAFFLYNILIYFLGGENILKDILNNNKAIVILISIFIGLIPGCGPQILLTTLYLNGTIPFAALMANAICNDGDALFPLLALNRKASIYVTLYNLIPAFIVGYSLYFISKVSFTIFKKSFFNI